MTSAREAFDAEQHGCPDAAQGLRERREIEAVEDLAAVALDVARVELHALRATLLRDRVGVVL